MYSVWSTSWLSGIASALVTAGAGAMQLRASSTPDPLPVSFIIVASLVVAFAVGIAVALSVRGGLHLARARHLALRSVLIIPAVSLLLLGILATWPVETHAIRLDMPSGQTSPVAPPSTFWLFIVMAISIPVLVSYVVGRLARGKQGPPPEESVERARGR